MPVQIAERWFETRRVDDAITLLWEPHVVPLMRCNIWHVRGRDRDLLIDTGMGIVSLRDRLSHPAERGTLRGAEFPPDYHAMLREAGYTVDDDLITALPHEGYDLASYRLRPATPTRLVEEGSAVDTGDRRFEVLHLPGHSPGSIGLWEAASGTLFSGDAIYDGPLLDQLGHSNVADYIKTMRRLRELPVRVVHAGHDPSFGRARLIALVDAYLARRDPERQASQQHAAAS